MKVSKFRKIKYILIYIASIKRYSLVCGSISSIVLLLLWLYYSILVYLFGAEVTADLA
ncbi:MAG: YhjD/YihY/BrkB family envelope integrity protein [Candidatus Aminicenantes bacterium]